MSDVIDVAHYKRLIQHVEANAKRHTYYGPCDGFAKGACSECNKIIRDLVTKLDNLTGD